MGARDSIMPTVRTRYWVRLYDLSKYDLSKMDSSIIIEQKSARCRQFVLYAGLDRVCASASCSIYQLHK